ncbi:hypothetical protein EKO27_g6752 [Xylaria grammica]|uniref:Jacalin-type lectin domain-containing protein n=1 Tax=Xylaria grammica TaxID=363999 RepID=A0A439D238_9PEZI|nr:hypothetical protein EKO27_g6752 [Xylaria grammica]
MSGRFNLKQIRRRSLATFKTNRSTDTSSNDEPSSSGQELSSVGSITPPSLAEESDPALHTQIPAMTRPLDSNSNRFSIAESVASEPRSTKDLQEQLQQYHQPLTQFGPRVTNIRNKSTDPHPQIDGALLVTRPDKAFPPTVWPVHGARFKALVYLFPGPNTISFEYQRQPGQPSKHRSNILLFMFDPKNAPPLQLAIFVAKDSPHTFDHVSTGVREERSGLETATCKFRTAAYLWQSFTAEQMEKGGLGRRTFRFDEEWTNGTSHPRDFIDYAMRSEARVHIIRTDKTVAEIRDLERAQKDPNASEKSELVDVVAAALRDYFRIAPGQKQYVATLILDAHWDTKEKTSMDHAAFGGQVGDDLHLAMFGSHFLQYYPSTICDVVKAFKDCSSTGVKILVDEANVAGTSWEAAAYGMGAHLREVGHLLGSPRQENGIMARDFVTFNRAFMIREAYSTRTKSKSRPVEPKDEPTWHRLDLLGYRFHPLFRNATDKVPFPEETVHGWVVEKDKLLVTASSGLLCTEIFAEGDETCGTWFEYPRDGQMVRRTTLIEAELRERLPESKRRSTIKIVVRSMGGGTLVIDDLHQLCTKSSRKLTSGPLAKLAYRSTKVGSSKLDDSAAQEVVFKNAVVNSKRILTGVTIYHGNAVDGLEFHFDDLSSQLFGRRGGKTGGDRFNLDIRDAEVIIGFAVRAGSWIDAIQIITSTSRKSSIYGNTGGGSLHTLLVPNGFRICGVSGSCGDWLDSFSLLITR